MKWKQINIFVSIFKYRIILYTLQRSSREGFEYYVNKLQYVFKYNLLMKKLSQAYFRQIQTKPSRNQSPDLRASNSIRPTRSPQNIQYVLKQGDRHLTPVKGQQTPKSMQHTAAPKYFVNNRSQQHRSQIYEAGHQTYSQSRYCHSCVGHCNCVHKVNNQEVVIELRKIITMINGAEVSTFQPQSEDIKKQVLILSKQNQRLVELVQKLKDKSQLKSSSIQQNLEAEIKILRQQINHKSTQFERDREQLYRTNKTLSSKVKSLEDKNLSLQKQAEDLRSLLRQRDDSDLLRDQQSKKKNNQQKLSISMIKQQYNESVKTLRQNIEFQIENSIKDHEAELRQYKMRIDILQERLRGCQRVNGINNRLSDQNSKLKKQLDETNKTYISQSRTTTVVVNNEDANKLRKQKQQMADYITLLNKQIQQSKLFYDKQLAKLKENQSTLSRETEIRVQKLMENYEQEIKILKRQAKSSGAVCNHAGIEQENAKLKQENDKYWQQIIKMRNDLVKYTADKTKLQSKVYQYENQISKLNHQINSDHLNFVAHTTLLQNENAKLKKDLEEAESKPVGRSPLEDQNQMLRSQIKAKDHKIAQLTQIQRQKQQLQDQHSKLKQRCLYLQEDNVNKINDFNTLKAECMLIQSEYKFTLNKQLDRCRAQYEQQIHKLRQDNGKVNNQLSRVRTQYSNFSTQLKTSRHLQTKAKDDKIYDLELTIRNLSKIIQDTQFKIAQLEEHITKVTNDNQFYKRQNMNIKNQHKQNIQKINQNWQRELFANNQKFGNQIRILEDKIRIKQKIEQQMTMKINSKYSRFKTQSLRKELQELKRLVNEGNFEKLEDQLARISQNYERQLIRSEQKTMEIDSLTKQKCALDEKITNLQKLRLVLEEKINILSGNIKIVENQLKQRKVLCDNLLNQKLIIEKQNLMLKKIKLDRESIEATKAKARQISLKIDRLLALEEQRQQNFVEAVSTHSQVLSESITRKYQ